MKCDQICKWNSNVGCIKPYGVPCILGNVSITDRKTTNADRIRAMSDEELAVFLSMGLNEPCDYCQLAVFEGACTETLCDDAMMKWLQEPPKEETP